MNSKNHDQIDDLRLQVYLAHAGIASRRSAVDIIEAGRVRVNGKVVLEAGKRIHSTDVVEVDGRKTAQEATRVYYVLHKPSKVVCSTQDEDHRTLAVSLIQPFVKERLFTVGRLDYMTSGLLLMTNDGDWARRLMHPSSHIEKEYLVETKKEIPEDLMEEFKTGIWIDGEKYQCHSFQLQNSHQVRLVLTEGKNREIRKVFQRRAITVKRVHRLRFGPVVLRNLEPGKFRKLTAQELKGLNQEESHGHRH